MAVWRPVRSETSGAAVAGRRRRTASARVGGLRRVGTRASAQEEIPELE
jgi:hypothetical protein